jgi:hypothetical protein
MTLRFSPEGLVLGAGLVGVGTLDLLSRLGRLDFLDTLHTFWPLAFILWGAIELFESLRARRGRAR